VNAILQQFFAAARRYPLAVISLLLLLVLGGADWFLLQRWGRIALEAERTRQEGEAMFLSLGGHSRIQAQSTEATNALAYIERNLATEADLAGNLDYFYQIEKTTHIQLTNLSQLSSQPASAEAAYLAIPFSLRLSGSYPQILAYLHALETGPRLARVKSYRFAQGGTPAEGLTLDLTVEMLGRP
jgi:Tfp pilus assembly protein PilO